MDNEKIFLERFGVPRIVWAADKDEGPNKQEILNFYYKDLLNRTIRIFKYTNLPDSLPEREFERILQTKGKCIVTESKKNGGLIALYGNYAPPLDCYYVPKNFLVANPWADINQTFTIYNDKEAVLVRNDAYEVGLIPLIEKFANHIMEADISIDLATINLRDNSVIVVSSDDAAESAREYNEEKKNGRQSIIIDADLTTEQDKAKLFNTSTSSGTITQLLEARQYWYAQFYNSIGLNANFNMKRESINSSETDLNEDGLRTMIDVMLEERKVAVEKINKRFGTSISVEFDSAWNKYNEERMVDSYEEEDNSRDSVQ